MCTAITYNSLFGRNLDFDFHYGQKVVFTPRNVCIPFHHMENQESHYAILGMGIVAEGFPHYFDAMNEKGLAIAGLNFVGNAFYHPVDETKRNLAQFELIPYILCTCSSIQEVKDLLKDLNIDEEVFSPQLPSSSLHWMVADEKESLVIESQKDGLHVYEDHLGVLTNNPPFPLQLENNKNYENLTVLDNEWDKEDKTYYSRGLSAVGLPGDLSSMSRFVKCAFTRKNSRNKDTEEETVSQFFHILHSVEQQDGCCEVKPGYFEITQYSDCMNLNKQIFYYTTYNNPSIIAVDMNKENLDGKAIKVFDLKDRLQFDYQN